MSLFNPNANKPEEFKLDCTSHLPDEENVIFRIKPLSEDMINKIKKENGTKPYQGEVLKRTLASELEDIRTKFLDAIPSEEEDEFLKLVGLNPKQRKELNSKLETHQLKFLAQLSVEEVEAMEEVDNWNNRLAFLMAVEVVDSYKVGSEEFTPTNEELIELLGSIKGNTPDKTDEEGNIIHYGVKLKTAVLNELVEHASNMMNLTDTEKKDYASSHG